MSTPEFAIPCFDLDAAGKTFNFDIRPSWLRGVLEGTDIDATDEHGEVVARLSRSGRDIVVRGHVRVRLVVPCARCLEPARISISEELTALAVPAADGASSSQATPRDARHEATVDDADTIPYDGETVVLDDLVRDQILLGIPMIPLCSEACPGISQAPAAAPPGEPSTVDIDPRLLPLMSVKKAH